jgi:hypothetical protein
MVFRECWQVVFLFMYGRWGLHKLIAIHYINKLPQTSSIIRILNELDFKLAVTTKEGKVHIGDPLLEIKRLGVYPEYTLKDFAKMVEN